MRWRYLVLLLPCPLGVLAAQDSVSTRVGPTRVPQGAVRCAGQKITDIIVITQLPYTARLPGDLEILRRTVRKLHATTRDNVVRRYLLLSVGDRCDEVRRAESERILRAQPFLVDARIVTFNDERGGVRLEVETRDEFSLVAAPNVVLKAPVLRGMRLGESNLAGAAIYAALQWRNEDAYRDLLGVRFEDFQFMGQRNVMRLYGTRLPQGHEFGVEVLRPYLTDLQRVAWRGKIGGARSYEELLRPGLDPNALAVDREFQDIGAVGRLGTVGRLKLVGLSLSRELVSIGDHTVQLTKDGFRDDDVPGDIPGLFHDQDVTRVNALIGVRGLRFVRVNGFDALNGVQDIRVGLQVGTLLGRSVQWLGARDRDAFFLGDIYAGYGNEHSYLGMQTLTEARRDRTAERWEGVLTSGRLAWYLKPAAKQLTLTEVLWATGTSVEVPYQLSFSDPEGGLRGYGRSRIVGAHRVVLRAEERFLIPSRYNVGDFGAAAFVEAGKLWAEHVPYANISPVRGSVGVSLMAAVPTHSRRLWRVDFALPVGGDPDSRFEVRFTNQDRTRVFWKDPIDVQRARERAVPTSVFTWP